jgi:uncharacterized membrane protein YdjX (TVP38/TMEM64 family)
MNKRLPRSLLVVLLAAALGAFFALDLGRWLSLEQLRAAQAGLEVAYRDRPLQVIGTFFAVYVAVTALSLPGAVVLTLAGGAGLGLLWGTLLVSFASTVGATLAMLSARYLLRGATEKRFASRLAEINQGVQRDGGFYLFSLRLIPVVPFFARRSTPCASSRACTAFHSGMGMMAGCSPS